MLTKADEYPLHQTPEPIAFAGTDRNFYDRFFFNGMSADGALVFAAAFGVYPQLDIMDAAFSVLLDGKQHVLRASRHMNADRLDLTVGPIAIRIEEPLSRLRLTVVVNDGAIAADLTFHARHAPIEEPRFTRRIGTRAFMDYTRMTQNGGWSGRISIDGKSLVLAADTHRGTRDRSWGVRPVGKPDPQPPAGGNIPQFHWLWTPANFDRHVAFCHTNDDEFGRPWNRRAVVQALDGPAREYDNIAFEFAWKLGTRRLAAARIALQGEHGEAALRFTVHRHFYMAGLGYTHPEWGHGMDRGALAVAHEVIDTDAMDDNDPRWLHIQGYATALLDIDGATHRGTGVVEQFFLGPHATTGMTGLFGAPAIGPGQGTAGGDVPSPPDPPSLMKDKALSAGPSAAGRDGSSV